MGGNGIPDRMHARRVAMVELQLRQRGIRDQRILQAMAKVPRHEFVPQSLESHSYEDQPVPIGEAQTISQPYIVAAMLEPLSLATSDRVLEIGTGSGYQTALLAELAGEVFSIERFASLAAGASGMLERLGYRNVHVRVADGSLGWREAGPFDAIVVSAAVPQVPPSLVEQMKDGARLIAPVGTPEAQDLLLIRRVGAELTMKRLDGCRFVPLVGEQGFSAS
jgi:protein-L-isoaspartate(D-aspartate) O-methyltransferase